MRLEKGEIRLSASDLAAHGVCAYLTTLDLEVAHGQRRAPFRADPHLAALRERGAEHERAFLGHLRARGVEVFELPADAALAMAAQLTLDAMRRGFDAIAQATLLGERWQGRVDVLLRVERPSPRLGAWSYEPIDTKLARETKAATVLQLCLYAELLASMQGTPPERMSVVPPGVGFVPETYRTDEYLAYYRRVRESLERGVAGPTNTYPLPCAHCDICRWLPDCEARWQADDHLCVVAGMRRAAERELLVVPIPTTTALAAWGVPVTWRPERGARASYVALQDQARLQVASRGLIPPLHELLPVRAQEGLARLPEPARGDVFLDLEGDPFFGDGGLEYLFGLVHIGPNGGREYRARWGLDRSGERAAFEAVMDELVARWERVPQLHVYHFGHYEPAALKRLASRHGTREDELDALLRARRFVDLHKVMRQGVRAGVDSYSIKRLEALYAFQREAPLREAGRVRAAVEVMLELGRSQEITPDQRALVEAYNRDDCRSTSALRDWLEVRRSDALASGTEIPRPVPEGDGTAPERLTERLGRVRALAARLLEGVPEAAGERTPEQSACWLLAASLEFHRREDKVGWWDFFRLADLDESDRHDEPCAIAGLQWERRLELEGRQRLPVDRYTFPPQEVDGRSETAYLAKDRKLGKVEAIDVAAGWVEIKKRKETVDEHPASVFLHDRIDPRPKDESLERLAQWVVQNGWDAEGPFRAACDLLLATTGRGCDREGASLRRSGEDLVLAARRLGGELDGGVLPIQGPPGAGKTYTGARMVVELVRRGKKVGITALSHKVIRNLLNEIVNAASGEGVPIHCIVKVKEAEAAIPGAPVKETEENVAVRAALASHEAQVAAGTAWLWSREDMVGAVDVLFVDEAGQMALADALAVAPAARSVVLLGDPQQLEQPVQGTHPDGCDVAALSHVIGGEPTVAESRGLFLEHTWRLHPALCAFTSEQFYEGRLSSRPGLELQALHAPSPFDRCGLFYLPVDHQGSQNASVEEAEAIATLVEAWLTAGMEWTSRDGVRKTLSLEDVLIVAPYNAQLAVLKRRLPAGARIGTVDKFQGQQAPIVIYSMATSSPEEAPRGMEFLYSRNRLNVATSRAQCACVLVASPRLLLPDCRTPRQMRLANALCRFVEVANRVGPR